MYKANTQKEYLKEIESNWDELKKTLAECDETLIEQPGACGPWSPKDVMAHITWFEREMIGVLEKRALTGSDWWNFPTDERNQRIYEATKDRSLDEIRTEFYQVHADLLALLQNVTDEELANPSKFTDMPPNWIPVEVLAGNTSRHYLDHARCLREWLASLKTIK